jgi:hypothetical protein
MEIKIDEERMALLRDVSRKEKKTLGAVIREAIDAYLKSQARVKKRLQAVEALGKIQADVGTPQQLKKEILDGYYKE